MSDPLDASSFSVGGQDESSGRLAAGTIELAVDAMTGAKTDIDQLAEMLDYFTRLGASNQLRDYREVRANLARSRELLSRQADVVARLTEATLGLARLIGATGTKALDAGPAEAPKDLVSEAETAAAIVAMTSERPVPLPPQPAVPGTSPAANPSREELNQQKIVSAVFSEIEAILRRPN